MENGTTILLTATSPALGRIQVLRNTAWAWRYRVVAGDQVLIVADTRAEAVEWLALHLRWADQCAEG